jgi:hypothetical protein
VGISVLKTIGNGVVLTLELWHLNGHCLNSGPGFKCKNSEMQCIKKYIIFITFLKLQDSNTNLNVKN